MIPDMIVYLVTSGWICVAAVAILWLETAIIVNRRPHLAAGLLPNALSGTFLLAALGSSLIDSNIIWTAIALLGAFAAHLVDLAYRLRGNAPEFKRSTE